MDIESELLVDRRGRRIEKESIKGEETREIKERAMERGRRKDSLEKREERVGTHLE